MSTAVLTAVSGNDAAQENQKWFPWTTDSSRLPFIGPSMAWPGMFHVDPVSSSFITSSWNPNVSLRPSTRGSKDPDEPTPAVGGVPRATKGESLPRRRRPVPDVDRVVDRRPVSEKPERVGHAHPVDDYADHPLHRWEPRIDVAENQEQDIIGGIVSEVGARLPTEVRRCRWPNSPFPMP